MSKRKKKTPAPEPQTPPTQDKTAPGKERRNLAKHSTILFVVTAIALLAIFLGRWVYAITEGYFASFVQRDASVSEAVSHMDGLEPTIGESERMLPLQQEWDLFTSSRLRDEVTVTAADGVTLHGYLYDEGSDVTVVVLPRYNQDGTADFLPGPWLWEETGCNLLLPDPRAHGGSGGDYFGFGYLEQNDLVCWLDWAEESLGEQTFLLWGEGTGANTALFAAASGLLPDSVAFLVAESPYASLHQLASTGIWNWYQVPAFPFLNTIEWKLARSDAGYTVEDANLGAALENSSASLPVLFLFSDGDAYIRPEWSEAVYDRYPGPKELVRGSGSHGTLYSEESTAITALLRQWCDTYLP